jgi:tetratricopeptide (TPR) repeat protein
MKKTVGCFFTILLAVAFTLVGQFTLYVPDDYPTIQAAIDAAKSWQSVYIKANTYCENITIRESIVISAEIGTVLTPFDVNKPTIAVGMNARHVLINNLNVQGGSCGLVVVGVAQAHARDCAFSDCITGVGVWESATAILSACEIRRNQIGVLIAGAATLTSTDCDITENFDGIETFTKKCGFGDRGFDRFEGTVYGSGNRIINNKLCDLCPSYPGDPWPNGFVSDDKEISEDKKDKANNLFIAAGFYYQSEQYEEALPILEEAAKLFQEALFKPGEAVCYFTAGLCYHSLSRWSEAVAAYAKALMLYEEIGGTSDIEDTKHNLHLCLIGMFREATALYDSEHYETAFEAYEEILHIAAQSGDTEVEARCWMGKGLCQQSLEQCEMSIQSFRSAAEAFNRSGFPGDEGRALLGAAESYITLDRFDDAINCTQNALKLFEVIEDLAGELGALLTLAPLYMGTEEFEQAIRTYNRCLDHSLVGEQPEEMAGCFLGLGRCYLETKRYKRAASYTQQAIDMFEVLGKIELLAMAKNQVALCYINTDAYAQAIVELEGAREYFPVLADTLANTKTRADVFANLGICYRNENRYDLALQSHETALRFYDSLQNEEGTRGRARVLMNRSVCYADLGLLAKAMSDAEEAKKIFESLSDNESIKIVLTNMATLRGILGDYDAALALFKSLLTSTGLEPGNPPRTDDEAGVYHNIGLCYEGMAEYQQAKDFLFPALRYYEETHKNRSIVSLCMALGNCCRNEGELVQALGFYDQALSVLYPSPRREEELDSYPEPELLWKLRYSLGMLHLMLGYVESAIDELEEAINVLEHIRAALETEETKASFFEAHIHDVYGLLIFLRLKLGDPEGEAFLYAERCRARTFLDALYQGSIAPDQLISPEAGIFSGAVDPKAIDQAVADARDSLQENEAVLEYMVTDSGVYLWVITKEEIGDPVLIEYEREQLMNDVITLRQAIENSNPDTITVDEFLASFYDKLIKESLAKLPDGVDTLILIPSGPLWYLPFSALKMSDQGVTTDGAIQYPYLVEHYTLAYLPSLASFSSLMKEEIQTVSASFVALANPDLSPAQVEELGISEYQYEQLEEAARSFAQCLSNSDEGVHVKNQAQEPKAYYEEAFGPKVGLYACHGGFNPVVPLQSKLFLALGTESGGKAGDLRVPDGNYHAWEVLLTDHRGTELAILAACETLLPAFRRMQGMMGTLSGQDPNKVELTEQQLKQIVVGDEVVGLARAFLSSGAEAVLGTLWLAHPTAIKELLVAMCGYHNQGLTWAQALREAQRELIKNNTFLSPCLWAPYQLIGRWR